MDEASAVSAAQVETELERLGNPEDARFLSGYFKTGPGQYGEFLNHRSLLITTSCGVPHE